jgi:beta-mannosidase
MRLPGRARSTAEARPGAFAIWATPPGAFAEPRAIEGTPLVEASAPFTIASALRSKGLFDLERGTARRFDGEDYWLRTTVAAPDVDDGDELALVFEGLATLADVWLDGAPVLASESMFVAHDVPIASGNHELVIRFRSLDEALKGRRPSPRWRVPMAEHQKLRFFRTTLLGRTPGWSPPVPPVGPWRDVYVERRRGVVAREVRLEPRIEGGRGVLAVAAELRGAIVEATVELTRAGSTFRARLEPKGDDHFEGRLAIPDVARWWPHTHGEPARYEARLEVKHARGTSTFELGAVGFRDLNIVTSNGDFRLEVNGAKVYARGAVWTPIDPVSFAATDDALAQAFDQVTKAGMNMLRVSGAIGYESDAFLDACDARGVLLWQDFAFANFDYPDQDPTFRALVTREAQQVLGRLSGRPALAVLCGGSENEQQAAMWGAPRERWAPGLMHELLPALVEQRAPGVHYWPSSAHGGAFPHQPSSGTTSYYGVGAYLRPLDDARRSEVKFGSECLAFANVPGEAGLPGGGATRAHHPGWKARSPRDLGAGWDFDDVRDHYLGRLFGIDPVMLRTTDHERYLALSRAVSGEVMAQVFAEWRRKRSVNGGGLIWFLRDLWAGAGWGVIEASGAPKAAYAYLRRAFQPITIAISDEGVNGLALHVANDGPAPLEAEIDLRLFRANEVPVGGGKLAISIAPHDVAEIPAAALLEGFVDLSYAYRFGPPTADLIVATLRAGERFLGEAFHLPLGLGLPRERDLGLGATAKKIDGGYELTVSTRRFAQAVAIDAAGHDASDDWFHVAPGGSRVIRLDARAGAGALRGSVQALNGDGTTAIVVSS